MKTVLLGGCRVAVDPAGICIASTAVGVVAYCLRRIQCLVSNVNDLGEVPFPFLPFVSSLLRRQSIFLRVPIIGIRV